MKRTGIIFIATTVVHYILTILTSFGAWVAQEGVCSPSTTSAALLQSLAVPLANALNFPLPFVLRDNSLGIMLCNSILFAAAATGIGMLVRGTRK